MFRQSSLKSGAMCFPSTEERPSFETLVVVPGRLEECHYDLPCNRESTTTVEDAAFAQVFSSKFALEALRKKEASLDVPRTVTMRMTSASSRKVVKLKPSVAGMKKKPIVTLR